MLFEHNNKVIFYTPNFIFSWDGEKFDRIWKMSDYAGARNSKGKKFMDLLRQEIYLI